MYPTQWYNNQNMSSDEQGYVAFENKVLGAARLRQLRVRNNSCIIPDAFADTIHECYDSYYDGVKDTHPFGVMNGTASVAHCCL